MRKFSTLIILTFLLLAGCSAKQETDVHKAGKDQTAQEEVTDRNSEENTGDGEGEREKIFTSLDKIPETAADLIDQPAGPFAEKDFSSDETIQEVIESIKDLSPLPENASEEELEEYFKFTYSQVAVDFPDPANLISKWEYGMSGDPDLPDSKFQFKENYNIEVILDASGSMAEIIDGKSMMDLAKEAITEFLESAPEDANVSLRVYGHKGTGSLADKDLSCSSIEQLYGYDKYQSSAFASALESVKPSGWTPLAGALEQAKTALEQFDPETNTNLIYLVSDGVETCDGDPVAVAKSFNDSDISPIINIIGFNVDTAAQLQLKEMARIADGTFTTVTNGKELQEEFKRADDVLKKWEDWKKDQTSDANAQKVEQSFEIIGFYTDWGDLARSQFLNLNSFLYIMKDEGIIDVHQLDDLRQRSKEVDKLAHNVKNEVREDLDQLNIEKLEEFKKEINEKYETNKDTVK